ncbi:MAG: cobalamin-dependent protein, partial [Planctomycetota bacterium]
MMHSLNQEQKSRKLLLTSVCRPLGPKYGDGESVGYELLYGQVTRAQGIFSPRATHIHYSLDYIANNLEIPTVVLHYPSRKELIRELKKGYDFVGISFIVATFHRAKEAVSLIRKYSPRTKIILGGYGTVLDDDTLKQYGDYICREEGVRFMRRLLGEPEIPMPYKHPLIESRLKVLSVPISKTGLIFAGLGCPNGCDFCCTSHFFKRKHIKLLPEGKDVYDVIERYLTSDPSMVFTIIDEDFLLDKKRAMQFRDCVLTGDRPISIFVFSSVKALSRYTVQEVLEMGIDGIWIGYEGTRSGYGKQSGKPVHQLIRELREGGIIVLTSMIIGFDYQSPEVISQELAGLMDLRPELAQFLIYSPPPGTPFYDRVMSEGLMRRKYVENPNKRWHDGCGFKSIVRHPTMSSSEIEGIQRWCFDQDFQRLGPSIYRFVETWSLRYKKWKESPSHFLQKKAAGVAKDIRKAYPVFLVGRLLGPNGRIRSWIKDLECKVRTDVRNPTLAERLMSLCALATAAWTALKLRLGIFQHPRLGRVSFRMPDEGLGLWATKIWESLRDESISPHFSVQVDLQHAKRQVWVKFNGMLDSLRAERLAKRIKEYLETDQGKLILDLENVKASEDKALETLAN